MSMTAETAVTQKMLQTVYLSYAQGDEADADAFRKLLAGINVNVLTYRRDDTKDESLVEADRALTQCDFVVVLIGPTTRFSRWVDMEVSLAVERRPETTPDSGPNRRRGVPGAGLVGIILKGHPDFTKPYYDPPDVPLRIHDLVGNEYATIRKWSDDPSHVKSWLDDADRRRKIYRSEVSARTILTLRKFPWNDAIDTPRPVLQKLIERDEFVGSDK